MIFRKKGEKMNSLTGGQWFAPTILLLLLLTGLSAFATKKGGNEKLKYWLNLLMYSLMIVILIMFWVWYF
ncbi:hypothetical protein HMPREF0548_1059 [Lactobacillus ultunensis DSM 16047]|uniref:Uncharacterized protein n=1 Tax=Lactobacillus ultunensis DSM 16047 TaxID=525365 RepID=C2EN13_9LACO|nr:hypothetical protein HMPREF0548_1059 [Lactobacillus ultunensis DSM 16047]